MTNANRPLPYADDIETIRADEADDIQRVVQALELMLARSQANTGQFLERARNQPPELGSGIADRLCPG